MHDLPYVQAHELQPETTAMMTKICINVSQAIGVNRRRKMALGVQVLAGGNRQALAVAQAADFDFIRAESFVYSHIADEGQMNACAGQLLRYRKAIGGDNIAILTDIKKKHCSHSITADLTVGDFAEAAEFFQADGVILTGTATGRAANPREISEVRSQSRLPIFIGSGITNENLLQFAKADGYIVGSHFKTGGRWQNQLDIDRIHRLVEAVKKMSAVRKSIP